MARLERDDSVRRLSDLPPQEPDISGFGSYNSIALPLVRRQFPQLFASSLVAVALGSLERRGPLPFIKWALVLV